MAGTCTRTTLLALTLCLLAACSSSPEKPQVDEPSDSSDVVVDNSPTADLDSRCDADPVHGLIGKTISNELAIEARNTADARFLRITRPNQPVTMDYNPQRLNIDIDNAGVILQVNCG